MGTDVHIDIDYRTHLAQIGDVFTLTTDGIHDFMGDCGLNMLLTDNIAESEQAMHVIST